MKKTASAVWQGGLKDGKGTLSTESGALKDNPYGFNTRFEGAPGTNPEELIGAAHAGCFSMALSMMLGEAGLTAERIETRAEVTLDKQSDGFAITAVHLVLRARVPGRTRQTSSRSPTRPRPVARYPRCSTRRSAWTPASTAERNASPARRTGPGLPQSNAAGCAAQHSAARHRRGVTGHENHRAGDCHLAVQRHALPRRSRARNSRRRSRPRSSRPG